MPRPNLQFVSSLAGHDLTRTEMNIITALKLITKKSIVTKKLVYQLGQSYAKVYYWLGILNRKGLVRRRVAVQKRQHAPTKTLRWSLSKKARLALTRCEALVKEPQHPGPYTMLITVEEAVFLRFLVATGRPVTLSEYRVAHFPHTEYNVIWSVFRKLEEAGLVERSDLPVSVGDESLLSTHWVATPAVVLFLK